MVPHSSSLARRTPWTEEPGGLWSMWSQTVKHDWVKTYRGESLGGLVIRILDFHCYGLGSIPGLRTERSYKLCGKAKGKK